MLFNCPDPDSLLEELDRSSGLYKCSRKYSCSATGAMTISAEHHQYIADTVLREAAIVLDKSKEYVIESRLAPLLRAENMDGFGALVTELRAGNRALQAKVIDALTTNETFFFREMMLFDALQQTILPELIEKRKNVKQLHFWCAACSSGQEPYSIAMLLRTHFPLLQSWKLRFIASDISDKMLNVAKEARYNQIEINRGLPPAMQERYFFKSGERWVLKDEIKTMVEFRKINLNAPWPALPKLDFVFMRNVLIYFTQDKKKEIFEKTAALMQSDGLVFLSATESAQGISDKFILHRYNYVSAYGPNPNADAAKGRKS